MRIGKHEIVIVNGPNLNFYVFTALFLWLTVETKSPWPIICWSGGCLVLIPICLLLHRWNEQATARHRERMLRDFPLDLEVQAKFGTPAKKE